MSLYNALMRWMGVEDYRETERAGLMGALSVPPAWFAHNKMCGDVGMLPLDVKKRDGRGATNDLAHDGYRLMREQPNKLQSPSVFKEQVTSHAIMYGNGRAAIVRNGSGVDEVVPMLPDRTWTIVYRGVKLHITKPNKDDRANLFDEWTVDSGGFLMFADEDVLHITGFTYNGVNGIGLLEIANGTFAAGMAMQKHLENQLRKGFRGKLFLEAPAGAFRNEAQAREFVQEFNKAESGPDNAGKAGLLREGIKANAVSMSNNDAQFVELNKFNRQDIALLFGLDSIPGDGESVSYNSLEQKNLAYLVALDRWLVKWEEQCDMKLRSPAERSSGSHYFKFNRAAIHRTDLQTTMTALCNGITHRIISPNEAREKLDMNPYDGGDVYENPAVTPGPANPEPEEPEEPEDDTEEESSDSMAQANRSALEETLRSLISREANNAISGARSKNFCDWIDRNYAKWEPKLADKLEVLGMDRDLARVHCEESRSALLNVAGESTQEKLLPSVTALVRGWGDRVYTLMGGELV
jgi:HK97 family phage portal protein